jgi:hypothetical protein
VTRKMWIGIAVAAAIITLIAAGVFTVKYFFILDDDDRPPIIVKNGSMTLDDGDPDDPQQHWKPWKKHDPSSARRWRPDHPNGKSVTNFTATITGSSDTTSCPAGTTFTGTEVAVEYTLDSSATVSSVRIVRELILSTPGQQKQEPLISAPDDLSQVISASPAPAPPRLRYDPGAGYVSKVTVTGGGSCPFSQPASDEQRRAVRIAIQPNR